MRNQWFIWILVAAVGVFVLFIFNYQSKQDSVSLSEIFPDNNKDAEMEYEFVNEAVKEPVPAKVAAPAVQPVQALPTAQTVEPKVQPQMQSPVQAQVLPEDQAKLASSTKAPASLAVPVVRRRVFGKVNEWVTEPAPVQAAKAGSTPRIKTTINTSVNNLNGDVPYTIQVGSYNDRQSAEVALKGIQAAGYPAYIGTRDLGAQGIRYRIYVGKYQSKTEANQSLSELKAKYQDSFIISPKVKQ